MTLRGSVEDFPLETIIQLLAATGKTGQLEVRGADDHHGQLGVSGGRLVSAMIGDDIGVPALGAIFSLERGEFEFVPWNQSPNQNLEGELDSLLDRAVRERDRIVAIREVIPNDRQRFKLSTRATYSGEIRMSPDQWKTLLVINGERDVNGVAQQLGVGRLAALAALADLVREGFVDVSEPLAVSSPTVVGEATPPPVSWAAPIVEPPAAPTWSAAPSQQWEQPAAPPTAAPAATWTEPAPAWPAPEPAPAAPVDPRDALMAAAFGSAPTQPAPTAPPAPADPRLEAMRAAPSAEWLKATTPAVEPASQDAKEGPKKGFFGLGGRKDEKPGGAALAERPTSGRAVQLSTLANALMNEFASGKYGKNKTEERLATLLMRVDEQADPIDRPLPVVDDRLDVDGLDRTGLTEAQVVPYLALLVTQVYEDAERAFGRDKAKKGYKAAQMHVFGTESAAVLRSPDLVERLPKV